MDVMMRTVHAAIIVAIATPALAAETVNKGPWARNRFGELVSTHALSPSLSSIRFESGRLNQKERTARAKRLVAMW